MLKYGIDWGNVPPNMIDLLAYRDYDRLKLKTKRHVHLKRAARELLDIEWNPWLDLVCMAYANYQYIAGVGCASSGKTFGFHLMGFLDYMADPRETQMVCTTTNVMGLKTRMWPLVTRFYKQVNPIGWSVRTSPHMMIKSNPHDDKHSIRGVPIERSADEQESVDRLIGAHTKRVIWDVDEATSAPSAVLKAWSNMATGTKHKRLVLLGNPDDQHDTLGTFCTPIDGWDSVNENTITWEFIHDNERGIAIHFDGLLSPNLKFSEDKWPYLFGHNDISRYQGREQELEYWRFCRGWWADNSIVPRVMNMEQIDDNKSREPVMWMGLFKRFFALDPAYGGDRAVLRMLKYGTDIHGDMVMENEKFWEIPIKAKGIVTQQMYEFIMDKSREYDVDVIGVDSTSEGSGICDYLEMHSQMKVKRVEFGGGASSNSVSVADTTPCCDKYGNMVTELWFSVARNLNRIRNLDMQTCIELCSRYYSKTKSVPEKLLVERKDAMRARFGKSPDLADSEVVAWQVFVELGGLRLKRKPDEKRAKAIQKKNKIFSKSRSYLKALKYR